jgi:hypothetical protein
VTDTPIGGHRPLAKQPEHRYVLASRLVPRNQGRFTFNYLPWPCPKSLPRIDGRLTAVVETIQASH